MKLDQFNAFLQADFFNVFEVKNDVNLNLVLTINSDAHTEVWFMTGYGVYSPFIKSAWGLNGVVNPNYKIHANNTDFISL